MAQAALRSYDDPCGIARALDLIGERWALLIVRELVLGPKRFTDLRSGLPNASPNVLSQRLRELEAGGVLRKRDDAPAKYELTPWGHELHPLLVRLGRWGAKSTAKPKGTLGPDALMVALEATFQPARAKGLNARIDLCLGEAHAFACHVVDEQLYVGRGTTLKPDAVIETDVATARAVVFGDRPLSGAPVRIEGDAPLARRFLGLFARP
jgi:DNA-binding HxlR family transcriptional regulator